MTVDVPTHDVLGRQLITFHVRGQEFCVDIESVREIRSWTVATPLPQAPPYVEGIINLRGTVLPVIDMAARLGLPPTTTSSRQVIIVVSIGGKLTGLHVDAVSDILSVPESAFQASPDLGNGMVNGLVSRLLTLEERLVGLIVLVDILPAAEVMA